MKKQKIIDDVDWILTEEAKNDKRLNPIDKNVLAVLQFVANEKAHTDGWFILPLKKNSTNTTSLVEYLEEFGIKCTYMTVFRTVTKLQYAGYIEYCKGFYNKIERYGIFPRIRILKGTVSCNRKTYNGVINYDTSDYNDIVIVSEENKTNCKPNTCNDIVIVSENTPENDKKTNTTVSDSYSDIVIEDIDIDIDIDNDIETDNNKLEIKKSRYDMNSTFYDDTLHNEKVNVTAGNTDNSDFSFSSDWRVVLSEYEKTNKRIPSEKMQQAREWVFQKFNSMTERIKSGEIFNSEDGKVMTWERLANYLKHIRNWLRLSSDNEKWCREKTESMDRQFRKVALNRLFKDFNSILEKAPAEYVKNTGKFSGACLQARKDITEIYLATGGTQTEADSTIKVLDSYYYEAVTPIQDRISMNIKDPDETYRSYGEGISTFSEITGMKIPARVFSEPMDSGYGDLPF